MVVGRPWTHETSERYVMICGMIYYGRTRSLNRWYGMVWYSPVQT